MHQRTQEQDGAVAKFAQRGALAADHAEHDVTGRRFLADRRRANVRRIPDKTALAFSLPVGASSPAARWK